MTGGVVIVVVLGLIGLARARFGDVSYEKFVGLGFAFLFGSAAILFLGAVAYSRLTGG